MTPAQIRLKIVALRSRLLSARGITGPEEEAILFEIEKLRVALGGAASDGRERVRGELGEMARRAGVDPAKRTRPPSHEGTIEAPAGAAASGGVDRRRHPRFAVGVPIRYGIAMLPHPELLLDRRAGAESTGGHASNVSRNGLLYMTGIPVPIGSRVELALPSLEGDAKKHLKVDATVVRRRRADDGRFEVGVRFVTPVELPPGWITRVRLLGAG